MFLTELFESYPKKIIVVYPGRFHIFHKGHKTVYDSLVKKFGDNVYIAASNKVEFPQSPFTFNEKKLMMTTVGIPSNRVVLEKMPYTPRDLLSRFDSEDFAVIFGVGEKDAKRMPTGYKKNGEPTYYQQLKTKSMNELEGYIDHGYIYSVPNVTGPGGHPISGTAIRKNFRKAYAANDERKINALTIKLFGEEAINNSKLMKVLHKLAPTNEGTLIGSYGNTKGPKSQWKAPGKKVGKSKKKLTTGSQKNVTRGRLVGESIESHVIPHTGAAYYTLLKRLEQTIKAINELDDKMNPKQKQELRYMAAMLRNKIYANDYQE